MEEIAYAKINLALHVRAREPDGYHRIETVFAFAEDGDVLRAESAADLGLTVEGPFAAALGDAADNLVMRAAGLLRSRFAVRQGAALTLDKKLPVASGIGGGSADAAAALRLLRRLWHIDANQGVLLEIAAELGADVPACVVSRTMRGEGRGERLTPGGPDWSGVPILLVNPGAAVSTATVFRAWNGVDRGRLDDVAAGRNDLQGPATAIAPAIAEVLDLLAQAEGTRLIRMSGSGATCFALFETEQRRDQAGDMIAATRPDWWQLASLLR